MRNLPQVKVGDVVTATYYESLAYTVKKPGDGAVGARWTRRPRAPPKARSRAPPAGG